MAKEVLNNLDSIGVIDIKEFHRRMNEISNIEEKKKFLEYKCFIPLHYRGKRNDWIDNLIKATSYCIIICNINKENSTNERIIYNSHSFKKENNSINICKKVGEESIGIYQFIRNEVMGGYKFVVDIDTIRNFLFKYNNSILMKVKKTLYETNSKLLNLKNEIINI